MTDLATLKARHDAVEARILQAQRDRRDRDTTEDFAELGRIEDALRLCGAGVAISAPAPPSPPEPTGLERRRGELAADLAEAVAQGDTTSAKTLERSLGAVERQIAAEARDAERAALADKERERRLFAEREAEAAEREAERRAEVGRLLELRGELAKEVDSATNTLTTIVGAYLGACEQLEALDQATPWSRHPRRLAEWLGHRLSNAFGGRSFERALTEREQSYRFRDVEADLAGRGDLPTAG